MWYLKSLDDSEVRIYRKLAETLYLGLIPSVEEVTLFKDLIDSADDLSGIKESLSDDLLLPQFKKYLDVQPDTTASQGCWIWTGASQAGNRPVFRSGTQTLSVRAKILEELENFHAAERVRITNTCGTDNCVRPAHLRVHAHGLTLWEPAAGPTTKLTLPRPAAAESMDSTAIVIDPTVPLDLEALRAQPAPQTAAEITARQKQVTAINHRAKLTPQEKAQWQAMQSASSSSEEPESPIDLAEAYDLLFTLSGQIRALRRTLATPRGHA